MTRALSLAVVLIVVAKSAVADCGFKFCSTHKWQPQQSTRDITNDRGQKVGDIYDPGHSRPLQIRNTNGRIEGYVEPDGTTTNRHGQRVLELGEWR